MPPRDLAWKVVEGGVELRVKAQPRARRAGLQGLFEAADGPRLRVAVNEAPEDGRASRAVCAAVAAALGLPPSRVALAQGASSREKTLRLEGDPAALVARLEALARDPGTGKCRPTAPEGFEPAPRPGGS